MIGIMQARMLSVNKGVFLATASGGMASNTMRHFRSASAIVHVTRWSKQRVSTSNLTHYKLLVYKRPDGMCDLPVSTYHTVLDAGQRVPDVGILRPSRFSTCKVSARAKTSDLIQVGVCDEPHTFRAAGHLPQWKFLYDSISPQREVVCASGYMVTVASADAAARQLPLSISPWQYNATVATDAKEQS